MKDENFEKTMDKWAAHEVQSAPQLRPTEEMYQMIEARKRKGLFPVRMQRILVAATAVCLVLSAIILPVAFHLLDQKKPSISLRKGFAPEGSVIIKNLPRRDKGPKKGTMSFHQLMFQYQKGDSSSVYAVDLRFPLAEEIALTAADNYRFVIQTTRDCYVYVYQLDSRGELAKILPNNVYSSVENPLQQGQTYHIPSEPNWLYLGEKEGEERIYVVASAQPMQELEELYAQYDSATNELRRESLSHLLKELDGELSGEDVAVWRSVFSHQ